MPKLDFNSRGNETAKNWEPKWGVTESNQLKEYMKFYTDSYKQFSNSEFIRMQHTRAMKNINLAEL